MKDYTILNKVDDNILKEMIALDNLVFKDKDIGNFDRCKEWLSANPDIYTVLLCNGKVIGYINFMPITDECYERFRQGKEKDYQLKKTEMTKFNSSKPLKCLFTFLSKFSFCFFGQKNLNNTES